MSARTTLVIGVVIVAACLFLGIYLGYRLKEGSESLGRYQVIRLDAADMVVTDSTTGQCWYRRVSDTDWTDLRSPAHPKK
jgi:hypothetical protein